jgi:hypothetical protein
MRNKKNLKVVSPSPEDLQDQHIINVTEGMQAAADVSMRLFGKRDHAAGVADRLISDADSLDEAAADLMIAARLAKEVYKVENPTPDMVFDLFDRYWPAKD